MTLRKKITVSILVLAVLTLALREFGFFDFHLYTSEATASSTQGPQGKFTSFPFEQISIKRVREFVPPAQHRPHAAEIQIIMAGNFPLTAWLPLFKFGTSSVVAVYQVYYEGMPIGTTFYATFLVDRKVKGICSQRGYRELIFKSAEASIRDHVEEVLKRPNQ